MTPEELEKNLGVLHERSFGWALACCRWDPSQAEDVLQMTYVKVLSGQARFGGRSAFATWLFGVIRRTALETRRSARSQRARALALHAAGDVREVEAADADVVRGEQTRELTAALERLPDRQREILHLVFYQDLTIAAAADVMGVSVGSARTHYHRGKMRLRELLGEDHG